MHSRRVWTAVVFIPLFVALVGYLPPTAFLAFVIAGVLLTQYEYSRMYVRQEWRIPTVAVGSLCSIGIVFGAYLEYALPVAIGLLGIVAIIGIGSMVPPHEVRRGALEECALVLFGVAYVGWMLSHLVLLRAFECGVALIFFVFLVTWASDTGGYYIGSRYGTRKLAPTVSPKKTVEGAIGGLVGSVAVALICKAWFMPWLTVQDCLIIGLLLGVIGQAGDLFESRLKRHAGVKDSGSLLPGHGGLLDRVDSLIFTAPVLFYYVMLIKGGTREFCV